MRETAVGIVVEVDRARFSQEELDKVNDLCEDTRGKLFRIVTFSLDTEVVATLLKRIGTYRAKVSYIKGGNGSPNDGSHFQVEELLAEEIAG